MIRAVIIFVLKLLRFYICNVLGYTCFVDAESLYIRKVLINNEPRGIKS